MKAAWEPRIYSLETTVTVCPGARSSNNLTELEWEQSPTRVGQTRWRCLGGICIIAVVIGLTAYLASNLICTYVQIKSDFTQAKMDREVAARYWIRMQN